jgi:beta-glucanase (GH16 family)
MDRRTFLCGLTAASAQPALSARAEAPSAPTTGSAGFRAPIPVPAVISRPTLLWADEFDQLDLSTPSRHGKWRPNEFWQDLGTGYRDFAGDSWNINPNQPGFAPFNPFLVRDSVLTISNALVPAPLRGPIRSTMDRTAQRDLPTPKRMGGILITDPEVTRFRYGYFEIRVRWPNSGRGMFPAIWLFRSNNDSEPAGKGGAEIDILEIYGDVKGSSYYISIHHKDRHGIGNSYSISPRHGDHLRHADDWHLISLDWQPKEITFLKDGEILHKVEGWRAKWFDADMSLRLNYGVDAKWFEQKKVDASTPVTLLMEIDYVRVYSHRP